MPRPLANAFFPVLPRFAGGGVARVPAIAHLVALDAIGSPFVLGGAWHGGDLALAIFCLTRAPREAFADLARAGERGAPSPLRRLAAWYARDPAAAAADAAALQALLRDAFRGWRTFRPKEERPDTGLPLAAALLARALPLFGGDLGEALACPIALAWALLQAGDALRGGPRILPDSVAAELDRAAAAARAEDLPDIGKKGTGSPTIGKSQKMRTPWIGRWVATWKRLCQGLAKGEKGATANG